MYFLTLTMLKFNMHDSIYKKFGLRRKFCKRIVLATIFLILSFYVSSLIFGDIKNPAVMQLTHLNRCPACYGLSICPELYANKVTLDDTNNMWTSWFNAKNIFYGYSHTNRRVVLKKLAHDWEFKEFDSKLCKTWNLNRNCVPADLLNVSKIEDKILEQVKYNFSWPEMEPRKGLVMCPYASSIREILPIKMAKRDKSLLINIWTALNINPEPIVYQMIPQVLGWPVPAFGGVCGRLEVVAYEGEPLSNLLDVAWQRKLKFAKQILDAAMDFTFKHERFRFYFMDWSLDNIVVNNKDIITFVDLEDVIILDKFTSPKQDLPDWYQRYHKELLGQGFTFSIENICMHHLSDHNLWAACYLFIGDEKPLLLPVPSSVKEARPYFITLLDTCLQVENRFKTVPKLQHVINEMLSDEKIMGDSIREKT